MEVLFIRRRASVSFTEAEVSREERARAALRVGADASSLLSLIQLSCH